MTTKARMAERLRLSARADAASMLSPEAVRQVLQDLRVYQSELELQNDELRRTQEQLEVSRARYVDLYDHAPIGYLTLSEAGAIQEVNLSAAALLGVRRSGLINQQLTRFIVPEDQDIYYHHRKELVATGTRQVCEIRLVKSDREQFWVRFEATLGEDASGALVCRAAVSDIQVRHRTEETLRASEARHRILFERSHDALMTLAPPDWRFTSGNSTTLRMFGAEDEAEFLSRDPSEYAPAVQPDGASSVAQAAFMIEAALRDGSHFYEWTYQRVSGEEFPASVLLTRLEIDGQCLLQATVRDETEVKRLQSMLGQADRLASMGMLAAGVAHEINNPLAYVLHNVESLAMTLPKLTAGIGCCLDALRANVGDDAVAKLLGDDAGLFEPAILRDLVESAVDALGGTERIRTIAKAIGAFSRMENSKRCSVDVSFAIKSATAMALSNIRIRARLVMNLADVPAVWASEGKLSQVFLNLLMNAAQAIDEGDSQNNRVGIRSWAEGDDVFVEVEDTGKGIPEEALRRVFEPFFTTKAAGVGSGLGLSICRNIVSEFGGDIRVESEVGKGTRFIVRLPVQRRPLTQPPASCAEKLPPLLARGRIMIVDDELAIRAMTAQILKGEHEIVDVASGEAARSILEHDRGFDVILCDLMMPGMTGMELHQWLLSVDPRLAGRVVFMTGGAFTPRASEYVLGVGNLRLDKPYDSAQLKRLVAERVASRIATGRRPPAGVS